MTADEHGSARRGGLSVREYERQVWQMARHQLHPTFLFVAAQVAAATRLLDHAVFQEPGGWRAEVGLFVAGYLGAWACFYSTLLRVAGLRSVAITIVVPLTVLAALAVWFVFPRPAEMSRAECVVAAATLVGPGLVAWPLTMLRWRAAKREAEALLRSEPHA